MATADNEQDLTPEEMLLLQQEEAKGPLGLEEPTTEVQPMPPTVVTAPMLPQPAPQFPPRMRDLLSQVSQGKVGGGLPLPGQQQEQPKPPSMSDILMQRIQSPEYQEQLKKMKEMQQQALDAQRQGIDISDAQAQGMARNAVLAPVYKWIDENTKGKSDINPTEQNLLAAKLQAQVQQQRQGLAKEQLDYLKSQLMDPMKQMQDLAKLDYYQRYKEGGPLQQMMQQRFDQTEHQNVLKSIDTDKTNVQRLVNTSNLANALNNFSNAHISGLSNLVELEQTIRQSLGTKGPGGVAERDRTRISQFADDLAHTVQYWEGPKDLRQNPQMQAKIQHLQDVAQREQGNFANQAQQRFAALTAGHAPLYQRRPDLLGALWDKINAAGGQYGVTPIKGQTTTPEAAPAANSAKVAGSKKVSAPTNNATPAVDANLRGMTAAELADWMKAHGGQ